MSIFETNAIKADESGSHRIFFGWYIVAAGMMIQAFGYGSRYSFSVFFPTLLNEFGWPRDMGASIFSTHLLFYGLTAPLAGGIVDRLGSRKTMFSGMGLLTLGLVLSHWGQRPWHFYMTFGVLSGIGLCLLGAVPLTMIVRNWFERRRGIALALVFFGTGAAYACYPAVAWLIDTLGWRRAYAVEGLIITAVFSPIIYFILINHPREKGLIQDGLVLEKNKATIIERERRRVVDESWTARDWTLPHAIKTYRFWLLCFITFSLWGVGNHIIITHQIAFAIDVGFDRFYASAVLSLSGWTFCIGALTSMISDRIGREQAFTVGIAAVVSSIILLLMIEDASRPWILYCFSVFFGFGFGMCAPLVASAVTDIFQGPKVGATVGFVWFCFAIGGAFGPWLGGLLFELTGNYRAAFIIAGVLCVLAGVAFWLTAPRKVRLVPGKVKLEEKELKN